MADWRLLFAKNARKEALTMPTWVPSIVLTVVLAVMTCSEAAGPDLPPKASTVGAEARLQPAPLRDEASPGRILTIPTGLDIRHHYYNPATGEVSSGARGTPTGELVYSNTPPPDVFLSLPANTTVADDLTTVVIGGCSVSAYEMLVAGGGDGTGPGFTVSFELYDDCPNRGGTVIPGGGGSLPVDDDGTHSVLVDLSSSPVPIASTLWLAVSFDRLGPGWVLGTQAATGFTWNHYDFVFAPCAARFAGTNLYAGFHTRIYCQPPFQREFIAYRNSDLGGSPYEFPADEWIMEDVELIVDDCILTSYEIGALAVGGGEFTMTAELRSACAPDSAFNGTRRTAQLVADGAPSWARFDFSVGVPLGDSASLWAAFEFSRAASVINSGEASVGFTDNFFGRLNGQGGCNLFWFGGEPYAGFAINVHCLGDAPVGACCIRRPGETCREGTATECIDPDAEWIVGQACDSEPFDPPCGTFACCLPEPGSQGACENLTFEQCTIRGGVSDGAVLCGEGGQACGWFECVGAGGDCCVSRGSPGCNRRACCNAVCDIDRWCCEVAWDSVCAEEAHDLCDWFCPNRTLGWLDPPGGLIDARQPHPPDAPDSPQGVDSLVVDAPPHDGVCCWTLCEEPAVVTPNSIIEVTANQNDTYTLKLARPLRPGTVSTITYVGGTQAVEFAALPGDANADRTTDQADILAVIDQLNGVAASPYGTRSCDIDHSGACDPPDIVRIIDLLNGASGFFPWVDATLPETGAGCP